VITGSFARENLKPASAFDMHSTPRIKELSGLFFLVCALGFNAFSLAPEIRIDQVPLNDLVFHRAASERLGGSLLSGEPLLDPWVSEWALGYPLWTSYQPLPHLLGALILWLGRPFAGPPAIFAGLLYLLVVTFPISVYLGARLLGLSPQASGLASLLVFASSSTGDPARYGLGYGSVIWGGSGLYTQIVALHLLALTMGVVARALDTRARRSWASILLGLTSLAHVIFGYVAVVSSAIFALIGPRSRRADRIIRFATMLVPALCLLAWFLIPLFFAQPVINHSRWEEMQKWDSYGAPFILGELFSWRLLDFGRPPVFTILIGLGVIGALLSYQEALSRRLLALAGLWLALFFGRKTWGHLLVLVGIPADFHLSRLQAAFELSAALLTGYGLARLIARITDRNRYLGTIGAIAVGFGLLLIGVDRFHYLQQNTTRGLENLAAYQRQRADLEFALRDVGAILGERPGRVSAGPAASWGGEFKIGWTPVYAFLTREHIDEVSFAYHSMSKTTDLMILRDANSFAQDVAFGIRAVIAPANRIMPSHLRLRSVHGNFVVYESSPEGYFGLVDVGGYYTGPESTNYEPSSAWLGSALLNYDIVISLDPRASLGKAVGRWQALPPPEPYHLTPRGHILSETKIGETYLAQVQMERPSYVLVKITWNPKLRATVDGEPAMLIHVTPGFGAVAVPSGKHDVAVRYQPGMLRPLVLLLGVGLFVLSARALDSPRTAKIETVLSTRLAEAGKRWESPRIVAAAVIIASALVALHPLFRGRLISGHDALEYPPRLTEMAHVLSEGHVPPVWAPDLGAGHGQPLFEFAPPLIYLAAFPFRALGSGLADALQFGLALLCFIGAFAVYRIGRRMVASRYAASAGAIAWLFAPYVSLDLFVRANFSEAAAVAVAPLAVLGLIQAMDRPRPACILLGAAGVTLVSLAHNAIALLLVPVLALMAVFLGLTVHRSSGPPVQRLRLSRFAPLASGGAVIILGLGLACYFWLPALMERGFVQTDRLREGFLRWSEHLVSPGQLLWSSWGYGLSVPGEADGMSFALGPIHLILGMAGLLFALRWRNRKLTALAVAFGGAAILGAWLSTAWAAPVWSRFETLQYLAYPWRTLALPALFLPLLAVFAFEKIGPRWTAALVGMLVVANLSHTEPKDYLTFDDEYYDARSIATKGLNTTTREEYEPRWVVERPPYSASSILGPAAPVKAIEICRSAARQEFLVSAAARTVVEASTFYYPGWTVTIDGVRTLVLPMEHRGTMTFELPAGEHRVVLKLEPTRTRLVGVLVSIFTLFLLMATSLWDRIAKVRSFPPE